MFTDIRNFLFGKSKNVCRREKESEKEWRNRRDKMLKELLDARRVEIDNSKAAALKKLQEAQGSRTAATSRAARGAGAAPGQRSRTFDSIPGPEECPRSPRASFDAEKRFGKPPRLARIFG